MTKFIFGRGGDLTFKTWWSVDNEGFAVGQGDFTGNALQLLYDMRLHTNFANWCMKMEHIDHLLCFLFKLVRKMPGILNENTSVIFSWIGLALSWLWCVELDWRKGNSVPLKAQVYWRCFLFFLVEHNKYKLLVSQIPGYCFELI